MRNPILPGRQRRLFGLGALALTLVMSGCDLLADGDVYAGIVVEAETGVPIEGIHISFQNISGFGGRSVRSEALTDVAGRFRLRSTGGALFVNDPPCYGAIPCPFNPAYSGGLVTIGSRDRTDLRFELRRSETP